MAQAEGPSHRTHANDSQTKVALAESASGRHGGVCRVALVVAAVCVRAWAWTAEVIAMAMPSFRRFLLLAGALVLLLITAGSVRLAWLLHRPVHVEDHFEKPELSSIWTADRMVPGAFSVQTEIVRSGHSAARITVHPNDRLEAASDDGQASERDELMEAPRFWSRPGRTYEYSFSLYLPGDFPVVENRLVIAQWKQLCEWGSCRPDNPVLAIRYVGGVLFITRKNDDGEQVMYKSQGELRGRWLDFRFVTRFSQRDDGAIDGWMNEKPIVHYRGVTAYRAARGYPAHGFFYFKMGLYRDQMQQPMTIYLDDYRKDQCATATCDLTDLAPNPSA
ncbi:MAG: polysaccharide lyase [Terracidiphilus sp.]